MHARLSCGPNTTALAQLADGDTFLRRHTWVLSAYLLLGLILTWPLVAHLATHVPGDGIDDPSLAWNLWWVKHALVDLPQNPFISAWQFWPIGINLAFYTLTVLNGMLGVPLVSALGVVPAYNLLLLSSFVLGGFGAYLLCLEFLRGGNRETSRQIDKELRKRSLSPRLRVTVSAFLAGALYAFASSKLFYVALGQGNIASSQWVPFAALYIVRTARSGGKSGDAALAALFLALQAYAEMTYASFLLVFAGLAFVWGSGTLLRRQRDPANEQLNGTLRVITHHVARFTFLAVLFALTIAPLLANMLPDLRAEGDFLTSGGGFADIFSADLAGYAVPTQLHPLLGGLIRAWSHDSTPQPDGSLFAVNKGQQIYLGYVALGAGGRRRVARPPTWGDVVLGHVRAALLCADPRPQPAHRGARHRHPAAFSAAGGPAVLQGQPLPQPVQRDADDECGAVGGRGGVWRIPWCVFRFVPEAESICSGRPCISAKPPRATDHAPRSTRHTPHRPARPLPLRTSLRATPHLRPAGARDLRRAWRPSRAILRYWSCRRAGATARGWPGSRTSSS